MQAQAKSHENTHAHPQISTTHTHAYPTHTCTLLTAVWHILVDIIVCASCTKIESDSIAVALPSLPRIALACFEPIKYEFMAYLHGFLQHRDNATI